MRILKLFKKHVPSLFAAIVLIVISCNADLALPTYMSDIVDVGVQQGGIASPVPDTIRAESLDDLELFMSTKDAKAVEAVFSKADKKGIRTYKGTEEERADGGKIADIMSLPETVVLSLNQGIDASSMGDMTGASTEASNGGGAQAMPTPEQMTAMTPEQLAEMQQKATAAQNMQKQIDADGGKITMRVESIGSRLQISVEDNGVGIAEDELHRVRKNLRERSGPIERRADSSRSTGIALRNVNRRIQFYFGMQYGVDVASTQDIGTTVIVTLPQMRGN